MKPAIMFRRTVLAALLTGAALAAGIAAAAPAGLHQAAAAKRANGDAFSAAQRDFSQFVQAQLRRNGALPDGFPLDVKSAQELRSAAIAYGFPVYTIDPPELLAGRGTMQSMARHTNVWRFVIAVGPRPIGMATVEKVNGRFEVVEYGAALLAKDLNVLAGQHGNGDKSNLRMVRIFQARSDLLEVTGSDGRARFAPMHSARQSLPLPQSAAMGKAGALLEEQDLHEPLRTAVRQNLAAPR